MKTTVKKATRNSTSRSFNYLRKRIHEIGFYTEREGTTSRLRSSHFEYNLRRYRFSLGIPYPSVNLVVVGYPTSLGFLPQLTS